MGQSQSLSEEGTTMEAYHPSAVGRSFQGGNASRRRAAQADDTGSSRHQKKSMAGPMRNRVRGYKQGEQGKEHEPNSIHGSRSEPLAFSDEQPVSFPASTPPTQPHQHVPLSSPAITASPSSSNRGDYRISAIPAHPSITEVPEQESCESTSPSVPRISLPQSKSIPRQASGRNHQPDPPSPAQQDGMGRKFLTVESPASDTASQVTIASTQVRRAADESNRDTLLAYWQRSEAPDGGVQPLRHSRKASTSGAEQADGSPLSRTPSPYRPVAGRWTTQWEDRRGLGISEDSLRQSLEVPEGQQSRFDWSSDDLIESKSGKVTRKPVPRDGNGSQSEPSIAAAQRANHVNEQQQQHILWPAFIDEAEEAMSKRSSHTSRASATTEALHSHVETIRAGPRYQIDPSASSLLCIPSSETPNLSRESISNDLARKRPRALSLMAKIKGRVRKNSDATTLSSPFTLSPSTPGQSFGNTAPPTPISPGQHTVEAAMVSSDSIQKSVQPGKSLYARARKPSKKSTGEEGNSVQADVFAQSAAAARRPIGKRSSRQSLQSERSVRSVQSRRSSTSSLARVAQSPAVKQRSNSQPLPHQQAHPIQQQWWKGGVIWPRRGSTTGLVNAKESQGIDEAGWVDEEEGEQGAGGAIPSGAVNAEQAWEWRARRKSPISPTGTELFTQLKLEQGVQSGRATESPPLALIGKSSKGSSNSQVGYNYSMGSPPSSTCTFTSLAPLPAPAPVPPPRPSRKTKRGDSSSNGGDSVSNSPLSVGGEGEDQAGHKSSRTAGSSPLSFLEEAESGAGIGMAAFVPAAATPDSSHRSMTLSDSGTKEILLSEDSDGPSGLPLRFEGDEADRDALMQTSLPGMGAPAALQRVRMATLSPVREARGSDGGVPVPGPQDEDDDEDGLTVTDGARSRKSSLILQSGASMGLPAPMPASPHKRPLPAPALLAEPRTDYSSVTRTNSIGSSQAASTMPSVASMKKHTDEDAVEQRSKGKRRPLPPTPLPSGFTSRHSRSLSMPSRASKRDYLPASSDVLAAAQADVQGATRDYGHSDGRNGVRQSWTSADGPWQADVVALPRTQPHARGLARAVVGSGGRLLRQRSSSSPLDAQWVQRGEETPAREASLSGTAAAPFEPVPFAETAVQASLAALDALERSQQGNGWQAQWARDKLMGSSTLGSRSAAKVLTPTIRLEPSLSELSDYSNSRTRRRAAPYSRSREDNSSSADERTRRSAKRKERQRAGRRHGEVTSSSLAELKDAAAFTSDSDHHSHRPAVSSSRFSAGPSSAETSLRVKQKRGRMSSFSTQPGNSTQEREDWDEKIVPALAKRLEVEAELEAEMFKESPSARSLQRPESGSIDPDSVQLALHSALATPSKEKNRAEARKGGRSRKGSESRKRPAQATTTTVGPDDSDGDGQTSRSRRTRKSSEKKKQGSVNRMPKMRKGYGCEDIMAWQASLGVAAPPTALVE